MKRGRAVVATQLRSGILQFPSDQRWLSRSPLHHLSIYKPKPNRNKKQNESNKKSKGIYTASQSFESSGRDKRGTPNPGPVIRQHWGLFFGSPCTLQSAYLQRHRHVRHSLIRYLFTATSRSYFFVISSKR